MVWRKKSETYFESRILKSFFFNFAHATLRADY
jgi:hypothetical protein